MEGVMKGFLGEMLGEPAAGTPLDKAQKLMYQAFGTPDPEQRVKLAKQALDLCPDCADAYVLLAEHTKSRKESLDLFEKGVAAGEGALGPKAFQENVGHFWSLLETRPICVPVKDWQASSGPWGGGTRQSNTSRTCCGSTPVTTRESDIRWPGG
jgi:hypothetical protein